MGASGKLKLSTLLWPLVVHGLAGVVAAGLSYWWVGPERFAPAGFSLAILVPPTLLTTALTWLMGKEAPEFQVMAALVSSGLRMFWAIMAVFGLGDLMKELGSNSQEFGQWMTGFYIMGLVIQVGFLVLQKSGSQDAAETTRP
jgi:hypothetical protein